LADLARAKGLNVRGVMGYEGHVVGLEDREARTKLVGESMAMLVKAHDAVGGDLVSAGGTGTYDLNTWANEIQAGSYVLMDTAYGKLGLPFVNALFVEATVISVSDGWAVADAGLKAFGMDHGNPTLLHDGDVWYCSDEHVTFGPSRAVKVGERVRLLPGHIDPTIAYHQAMHVFSGDEVLETWPVDMRGW
jgi:D-serine deaminase-like pyridoxal phosphate-dependent protein